MQLQKWCGCWAVIIFVLTAVSEGLVSEDLVENRCGWFYNSTYAEVNTTTLFGALSYEWGVVVVQPKPCVSSRRWSFTTGCGCSNGSCSRGHLLPRRFGGPAIGVNCISQSDIEQRRFDLFIQPCTGRRTIFQYNRSANFMTVCCPDCYQALLYPPSDPNLRALPLVDLPTNSSVDDSFLGVLIIFPVLYVVLIFTGVFVE